MKKSLSVIVLGLLFSTTLTYAQDLLGPKFSEWSPPVNLGPPINLPGYVDQAAVISKDERTIFFSSNRLGSVVGSEDIWVATRQNKNSTWQSPVNLGSTINTSSVERVRTLSDDGRVLLYQSDRTILGTSQGGFDIWAVVRTRTNDNFGWGQPINLGPVINTNVNETAGRNISANGPKMFFSSFRTDIGSIGMGDIYESEILSDGSFGVPINLFELNSPSVETCFWVRSDGLEIIFSSNRPYLTLDASNYDLWTATRSNVYETWTAPMRLDEVSVEGVIDVNPALSADGRTLFVSSRRQNNDMDIYMSTRRPVGRDQ